MTDHQATALELLEEANRAAVVEAAAQRAYERAVEYRVRMKINYDLAVEREAQS